MNACVKKKQLFVAAEATSCETEDYKFRHEKNLGVCIKEKGSYNTYIANC